MTDATPVELFDEVFELPPAVELDSFESDVVADALRTLIEWVKDQPDEMTRFRAAHWLQEKVIAPFYREDLAELRAGYARELYRDGYGFSEAEIGSMIGVSRARINQITRR